MRENSQVKKILISLTLLSMLILGTAGTVNAGWPFGRHVDEVGSGDKASEERDLDEFDRIVLTGSADIEITRGTEQSVIVVTDDNLLDNVQTRVRGRRTLKIDTRGSYSTKIGMKIYIVVPGIREVSVQGSGDVQIEDLDQREIEISVSGSGDIDVEGRVDLIEIDVDGSGDIDARGLDAKDAYVRIDGSGDVTVFASESFTGSINGSGDIKVYGDPPSLSRSVRGSGDITMR